MSENNTQVALPETFKPEIFKGLIDKAPQILAENSASVQGATKRGHELLSIIANKGMSDEMDAILNKYLIKVKDTVKLMNEKRSPITTMFTAVAKLYTGLEATLDPAKPDSIYTQIQKHRNAWAEKKVLEAKRIETERQEKIRQEQLKIELKAKYEGDVMNAFNDYITSEENRLMGIFNALTLDNFEVESEKIKNFQEVYLYTHFENIGSSVPENNRSILIDVKTGKFDEFKETFRESIKLKKTYYIDRLESKRRELEQIKTAKSEADKELLLQAANKRALDEQMNAASEALKRENEAKATIETEKQILTTNTLFDSQGPVLDLPSQVREGFEITVLHAGGFQLMIAKYFEKEGMLQPLDALEKMTFKQIKTFCEKLAKDKNEKIVSPYLRYKETFKAVTKR